MALLDGAIYSYLSGLSGITDLVSTRIYPDEADEGAAHPYIVFFKVTGDAGYVMGGETGVHEAWYQFDAVSNNALESKQLAELLRLAFSGFSGIMGSGDSAVTVDWTELKDEHDQTPERKGGLTIFDRITEFQFSYRQAVP